MTCNPDLLLALTRGELEREKAAEIERHASSCHACADELEWLRTEKELFVRRAARREAAPPAGQWAALADKIAVARERADSARLLRRRRRTIFAGAAGFLAAAAAVVLLVLPATNRKQRQGTATNAAIDAGSEEPGPSPRDLELDEASRQRILGAIHRAENEYAGAIGVLEVEYANKRETLPPAVARLRDNEVHRLRQELDEIRGLVGDDVDGRLRALQATAVYVRSMQKLVLEEETP